MWTGDINLSPFPSLSPHMHTAYHQSPDISYYLHCECLPHVAVLPSLSEAERLANATDSS